MSAKRPLIIGGGPAGSTEAIHLLNAGVEPLIIERRAERGDALCGGFLSWNTLEQLQALGLSAQELGGHQVHTLRLFMGQRVKNMRLPGKAMAISRKRLDGLLFDRARRMGAAVRHESAVYEAGRIRLGSGERITGESLFLATGKHDLRGLCRPRRAAGADPLVGLRLRLQPSQALRTLLTGHIEMHLVPGGYLGMVLQEDGSANLCMAIRKSRLAAARGAPVTLLEHLARENLALGKRLTAIPTGARIDAIGPIPYGWRATTSVPGVFRLGDQAGVIASLAGEGIGIALASAAWAVRYWREGGAAAAPAFQQAFAARLRRPLAAAGLIADLAGQPAAAVPLSLMLMVPGLADLLAQMTRIGNKFQPIAL
jgi:menaquinone-9 beta-reductase